MISIARDPQTLDTIVELKESLQNPIEHMYYLQEFVKRPPRDIRAIVVGDEIVATVYRNAGGDEWRTNVARGATTTSFKPDKELTGDRPQGGARGRRRDTWGRRHGVEGRVHGARGQQHGRVQGRTGGLEDEDRQEDDRVRDREREAIDGARRRRRRLGLRRRASWSGYF